MKERLAAFRRRGRDAGYGTVEYMLILLGVIVVAGLVVAALTGKINSLIAQLGPGP